MSEAGTIKNDMAGKVNFICAMIAVLIVLIFPLKKEIWYDETISILCSKGITADSQTDFAAAKVINSSTLAQLNTAGGVYKATVLDNGNSYLYNIGLHWFTFLFGNGINVYVLFSKLSAIAALLAFFVLCNKFFKNSLFTSLAIILLATDINFMGMSHEVRAYSMGIFFVTLAGIYFYKFMYEEEKPLDLFLLGLFSVATVLCHFLSIYIILVFLGYLVFTKKARLFSLKNILAMVVPVAIIAIYLGLSLWGLKAMSAQNASIQQRELSRGFSITEVIIRSLSISAMDFKAVFPAFRELKAIIIISFLLVIALYVSALRVADNKIDKRNLNLLFILGISSTVFLGLLCLKSHHYTALYYRYHSFCLPFSTLFPVYAVYIFHSKASINPIIKRGLSSILLIPSCALFISSVRHTNPVKTYNHIEVAQEIATDNVTQIEVPEWKDAFLVNSLLPKGYKIDYVLNPTTPYFTLYKADNAKEYIRATLNAH